MQSLKHIVKDRGNQMSANTTGAPYRADHVGSLLRPASVKQARKAHFEDGAMPADELRAIEDEAIRPFEDEGRDISGGSRKFTVEGHSRGTRQ